MNLCLETETARKVKFDEEQKVAVETDFGFRLTKLGKIKYCPKALVWHYHRASLKNYFRQTHQLQYLPMQIIKFWFEYLH